MPNLRRAAGMMLAGLLLCTPFAAAAQDERDALKTNLKTTLDALNTAEKENKALEGKRSKMDKELGNIQQELVRIAKTIQAREKLVLELEDSTRELVRQEKELSASLKAREKEMDRLLMSMMKFSMVPPEMVLAMPGDFDETLHTTKVLGLTSAAIREKADALKGQINEAQQLRDRIFTQKERIEKEQEGLQKNQSSLTEKLSARGKVQAELATEQAKREKEMKKLSADSKSLRDLLNDLETRHKREAAKRSQMAMKPVAKPAAPLKSNPRAPSTPGESRAAKQTAAGLPAEGRIYASYGEKGSDGEESKGIKIRTRDGAPVIAPFGGEVVYTGPFLDYGNLIILRHEGKYHSLLAGFASAQSKVGQKVLKGEPVARMGSGSATSLYVEIRKDNRPINPIPWLEAQQLASR